MRTLLFSGLVIALAAGCQSDKAGGADSASAYSTAFEVFPPVGGQGQSLEISLDASQSTFSFSDTSVDFGDGITIETVTVDDGWRARAQILVDPDAALGKRDVTVEIDGWTQTVTDGFEVISQSLVISPERGKIGETLDVDMLGNNTDWVGGLTWPSFGDDVEVVEFDVLSESLATATVSIQDDASPGWRNVVMDNGGGDTVVLYDGFSVDRVALAATFDPTIAEQGDTVEFTVRARDTNFASVSEDALEIAFYDSYGQNSDIVVDTLTVIDNENFYGQMTLSNAAALGGRDVRITAGDEGVLITDAFEVISGDWDLEEVAIDLRYYVNRSVDNNTGEVAESIVAYCMFYIPLDPPCPSGGGSGSGSQGGSDPSPYDVNGYGWVTGEGESGSQEDCPAPTTIGAGDYVWLESDANTITMDRFEDTSSGAVYYINTDLTMDDFVTDNWYDLHTQGEDGGIGEYLLDEVQPTVPSDWQWETPWLAENYTHDRSTDFDFTWSPAATYPDAWFYVYIWDENNMGPFAEEGYSGYLVSIPWDDGDHAFSADEMSLLADGGVPVTAYSFKSGPEFGLPESIYQENQARSWIAYYMYMVLE